MQIFDEDEIDEIDVDINFDQLLPDAMSTTFIDDEVDDDDEDVGFGVSVLNAQEVTTRNRFTTPSTAVTVNKMLTDIANIMSDISTVKADISVSNIKADYLKLAKIIQNDCSAVPIIDRKLLDSKRVMELSKQITSADTNDPNTYIAYIISDCYGTPENEGINFHGMSFSAVTLARAVIDAQDNPVITKTVLYDLMITITELCTDASKRLGGNNAVQFNNELSGIMATGFTLTSDNTFDMTLYDSVSNMNELVSSYADTQGSAEIIDMDLTNNTYTCACGCVNDIPDSGLHNVVLSSSNLSFNSMKMRSLFTVMLCSNCHNIAVVPEASVIKINELVGKNLKTIFDSNLGRVMLPTPVATYTFSNQMLTNLTEFNNSHAEVTQNGNIVYAKPFDSSCCDAFRAYVSRIPTIQISHKTSNGIEVTDDFDIFVGSDVGVDGEDDSMTEAVDVRGTNIIKFTKAVCSFFRVDYKEMLGLQYTAIAEALSGIPYISTSYADSISNITGEIFMDTQLDGNTLTKHQARDLVNVSTYLLSALPMAATNDVDLYSEYLNDELLSESFINISHIALLRHVIYMYGERCFSSDVNKVLSNRNTQRLERCTFGDTHMYRAMVDADLTSTIPFTREEDIIDAFKKNHMYTLFLSLTEENVPDVSGYKGNLDFAYRDQFPDVELVDSMFAGKLYPLIREEGETPEEFFDRMTNIDLSRDRLSGEGLNGMDVLFNNMNLYVKLYFSSLLAKDEGNILQALLVDSMMLYSPTELNEVLMIDEAPYTDEVESVPIVPILNYILKNYQFTSENLTNMQMAGTLYEYTLNNPFAVGENIRGKHTLRAFYEELGMNPEEYGGMD